MLGWVQKFLKFFMSLDFDVKSAWRGERKSKDTQNELIADPIHLVPGINLSGLQYPNQIQAWSGPLPASLHRWGTSPSLLCACGGEQTMEHITEACPFQRLNGRLITLHTAYQEATAWRGDFAFA